MKTRIQSSKLLCMLALFAALMLMGCAPESEPVVTVAPSAQPQIIQTATPAPSDTPAPTQTPVPQAKYIFLFIGDGMGEHQVRAVSEALRDADRAPLSFESFPVRGAVHTDNVDRETTDSAAAATAIACGQKTYNGYLGLNTNQKRLESIAETLRDQGRRIGILTTVSLDHATPAGFYAHVDSRRSYDAITDDLLASGFDYFFGGGFHADRDIELLAGENGFAFTHDLKQARALPQGGVICTSAQFIGDFGLVPAIDGGARAGELAEALDVCIERLASEDGFFIMVEGGRVDYFCHYHDAGSYAAELLDMDEAIRTALAFYQAHPLETLILVTADHETGDLRLKQGDRTALLKQTISCDTCDDTLVVACKENRTPFVDALPQFLDRFGLSELTQAETVYLEEAYRHTVKEDLTDAHKRSLYGVYEAITSACAKVVSDRAGLTFSSGSHTSLDVPIYALGVGSELFTGAYENAAICERIRAATTQYPID